MLQMTATALDIIGSSGAFITRKVRACRTLCWLLFFVLILVGSLSKRGYGRFFGLRFDYAGCLLFLDKTGVDANLVVIQGDIFVCGLLKVLRICLFHGSARRLQRG